MNVNTPVRILLVEDEPNDSVLVENALRQNDLPCLSWRVDNEADFLRGLEQYAPDLIISDHGLAHFSGAKALSVARESGRKRPLFSSPLRIVNKKPSKHSRTARSITCSKTG